MRLAIEWIKANLISVISIAVVVLSLGFLIAVPQMKGKGKLVKDLKARGGKVQTLEGYMRASVPVPAPRPTTIYLVDKPGARRRGHDRLQRDDQSGRAG